MRRLLPQGQTGPGRAPALALRVVADLDDALEAEILVRAAAGRQKGAAPGAWPPLVLVARPLAHHQRL
ncbi:hypothetical protein ABZ769_02790 [Streptomyces olivoreticuli]